MTGRGASPSVAPITSITMPSDSREVALDATTVPEGNATVAMSAFTAGAAVMPSLASGAGLGTRGGTDGWIEDDSGERFGDDAWFNRISGVNASAAAANTTPARCRVERFQKPALERGSLAMPR